MSSSQTTEIPAHNTYTAKGGAVDHDCCMCTAREPCTHCNGTGELHLLDWLHSVSSVQCLFDIHQLQPHRVVPLSFRRHGHRLLRHRDSELRFWQLCSDKVRRDAILVKPSQPTDISFRYQQLLGCEDFNSDNTSALYARYTTSVLCNAIIQNSAEPCGLEGAATRPLCADSCAEYAQSEQEITASSVCGNSDSDALTQIRADFTNCALPANSLSGQCISAVENESEDCGFSSNLGSLCMYCSSSSPNATDSCCVFSDTEQRCENVALPVVASSSLSQIVTTLTTGDGSSPTSGTETTAAVAHRGLTGGQIAGIVIGAVLGALALLALIIFGCLLLRKRRSNSPATSVFNQPATMKQIPPPSGYTDGPGDNKERTGMSVLGGGRVARMSALEHSGSPTPDDENSPILATGAAGRSSSDDESHGARRRMVPPQTGTRNGSLSSTSQLTP